jgi:hypothetical protein
MAQGDLDRVRSLCPVVVQYTPGAGKCMPRAGCFLLRGYVRLM